MNSLDAEFDNIQVAVQPRQPNLMDEFNSIKTVPNPAFELAQRQEKEFQKMGTPESLLAHKNPDLKDYKKGYFSKRPPIPLWNKVFCNRTLELLEDRTGWY